MLKEYPAARDGELIRRWFADDYFDLFVWCYSDRISAFQLCYEKKRRQRALTWDSERGFRHDEVDDGEATASRNRSPVLVADGFFPAGQVLKRFAAASSEMEPALRSFILEKLDSYAG